jgi:hypothetical protein
MRYDVGIRNQSNGQNEARQHQAGLRTPFLCGEK